MTAIIVVLLLLISFLFALVIGLSFKITALKNDLFNNAFKIADLNQELSRLSLHTQQVWRAAFATAQAYSMLYKDLESAHANLEMALEHGLENEGNWVDGYNHVATEIGINGVIYQFNKIEEPVRLSRSQIFSVKDIKDD